MAPRGHLELTGLQHRSVSGDHVFRLANPGLPPAQSQGLTNMRPSMPDGIAAAFPDLPLIAGHRGLPWVDELFEAL